MKDISNLQSALLADFADAPQRSRQLGAWNHRVEDVVAGSQPAKRAESILAPFPEEFAFGIVARDSYFAGVMQAANLVHRRRLRADRFGKALDLNQQDGAAVAR